MTPHILIAEDEPKLAALLADYLQADNMRVSVVHDGAEVLNAVHEQVPDLLLLDVMLPNRDGLSICRELRQGSSLPIIMVTARSEEIDRLLGLELGADDYVCKPFSPREVVARVKAVLRRAGAEDNPPAATTSIEIDERRMRVTVNDHRLELTPAEFRLMHALYRHPGRVYRRDELLDLMYDDFREVSDRTVDSHIKNLRRKLAETTPDVQFIHAVYGIGYKLELD